MGLEDRFSMGCERVYTKHRPGVATETRFEPVTAIRAGSAGLKPAEVWSPNC